MCFDSAGNCFLLKHVQARVPSVHGAPAGTGGTGNTGEDRGLHASHVLAIYTLPTWYLHAGLNTFFPSLSPQKQGREGKLHPYVQLGYCHVHTDRYVNMHIDNIHRASIPTCVVRMLAQGGFQQPRLQSQNSWWWLLDCLITWYLYYAVQWLLQNENFVVPVESLWINSCTKTNCIVCFCAAFVSLIFLDASLWSCITALGQLFLAALWNFFK